MKLYIKVLFSKNYKLPYKCKNRSPKLNPFTFQMFFIVPQKGSNELLRLFPSFLWIPDSCIKKLGHLFLEGDF